MSEATAQPFDPNAFREFEHAGWEEVAHLYHDALGSMLTPQFVGPLLDAVRVGHGCRLLDVATGPGYGAAAAAERGAAALGIDFSAAVVVQARQRYPTITFQEGDAEELPFPDESFDAVVMNFGLLHFGRPERAVVETHRVLRRGGLVGFTVWAKPEEAVPFGIILRAVETHGTMNVPLPPGPPFFRFSDPDECRRVLLEAGFVAPEITQVSRVWQLPSPDSLFQTFFEAGLRIKAVLRAQTDEALNAIRTAVRDAAKAYERAGVIELPVSAVLASATKP